MSLYLYMKDISDKTIIIFGCGGVGKALLHYLDDFFVINPKKLILVDLIDYKNHIDVSKYINKGASYYILNINDEYKNIIKKLQPHDLVIDLTFRTNTFGIMEECKKYNIHCINTSIEYDEIMDLHDELQKDIYEDSYLCAHRSIIEISEKYKNNDATSIATFGFNPGMISMFIKNGIMFMMQNEKQTDITQKYIDEKNWIEMAEHLKLRMIHCSEIDTTEYINDSDKTVEKNENHFSNTWCSDSFVQESMIDKCEFGYGQSEIIPNSTKLSKEIIVMNNSAVEYYSESYVPGHKFIGMMVPHSENVSGSLFFKMKNPLTIYYAYKFSPITYRSLATLAKTRTFDNSHIINNIDDNVNGYDAVGALLLCEDKTVWTGSILNNDIKNMPTSNPTLVQVAISVLSALHWMCDNPNKGVIFPEEIDHEYMLNLASPYLGLVYCDYVDYKPESLKLENMMKSKEEFNAQYRCD